MESSNKNHQNIPNFLSHQLTVGQFGSITNFIKPPTVSSQNPQILGDGNATFPVLRNVLSRGREVGNEYPHQPVKSIDMPENINGPGPATSALKDLFIRAGDGNFHKIQVRPNAKTQQKIALLNSRNKVLQPKPVLVPCLIRSPQVTSTPLVFNSKPIVLKQNHQGRLAIIENPQQVSNPTIFNQNPTQLSYHQSLLKILQPSPVQNVNSFSRNNFSETSCDDEVEYLYTEDGTDDNRAGDKEDHIYACHPSGEHSYSKCGTPEEAQRVIGEHRGESVHSIPSNGSNKECEKGKEDDLVLNSDIGTGEEFSTTLKTSDGGEQVMVVNPILDNTRQTNDYLESNENDDSSIFVEDTNLKTMKKSSLNEQINKKYQAASETENPKTSCEWKIESVYSLALQSDSMNQDSADIISTEDESISDEPQEERLEEYETQTFSLTGSEWKEVIKPSFVVLERLAESKDDESGVEDSASRCSQYCRLRTLKLLCDLNLLNCYYKNDDKENVSEVVETPEPIVSGGNMYDRVKKPELKRKSTTSSPYSPLIADEKKSTDKTTSSLKAKSENKDSEALWQLKAQIARKREDNKNRKNRRESGQKPEARVNNMPIVHQGSLKRISLSQKRNTIVKNVVKEVSKNKDDQTNQFHHSGHSSHNSSGQSNVCTINKAHIPLLSHASSTFHTKIQYASTLSSHQIEGNGVSSFRAQNSASSNMEQNPITSTKIQTATLSTSTKIQTATPSASTKIQTVTPSSTKIQTATPSTSTKIQTATPSTSKQSLVSTAFLLQTTPPNAMKQPSVITSNTPYIPQKSFSVVQSGSKRFLAPSTTAKPVSASRLGETLDSLSKFIQKSPDKVKNDGSNYFLVKIDGQHVLIKTGAFPSKSSSTQSTNKNFRFVSKPANMQAPSLASSLSLSSSSSSSGPITSSVPNSKDSSSTYITQQKYGTTKQTWHNYAPKHFSERNKVTKIKQKSTSPSLTSSTPNLSSSFIAPPKHNPKSSEVEEKMATASCKESASTKSHLKRPQSPPTTLEELKRRKRRKLEAKYPLPPGVIIKSEPLTTGYDLDNNWSVTSEIDMGFVQGDLDHDSTSHQDHSTTSEPEAARNPSNNLQSDVTTSEPSDDMPPMLEKVSPSKGPVMNSSFDCDKAPPVLLQMSAPPLLPPQQPSLSPPPPLSPSPPPVTNTVTELHVDDSHDIATPSILQTSPSLPQLSSPPQVPSRPPSFSSPPPLPSPFKTASPHSSPLSKVRKNNDLPLDHATTTSPLNPTCESGYNSLTTSSSSETLSRSSSSSQLVNDGNGSTTMFSAPKSKIQQLKELLRKKEQQVDNFLKIQSQLPQVDLDSI